MDWLGRLLGNVGRFLGSVATAPSRAGQAAGKAVRREVQNAAPVVQREIVRPSANIVRAATPKIDLAKVGRFMIGDPNVNPIAKAQRQIPQALGRTAQFVAPNISKAVAHPSTIYGTKSFQKVAQGKASPQEFLKEIFKVGVPLGLDAANFVGGVGLAGKQGVKAIGGQLLKEAGAYTAGSGANKLIQGETAKNVVRQLPADFAGSLAAQGLGFGAGKLLGKAGSIGANRVASNAPAVRMVVDPQTGKQIRAFAPKVNLKAAQPMAPAKAIAQEVRPPAVKLKNIHLDDQAVMGDIIDYARGVYKPSKAEALRLELDARRIAERYKIRQPETIGEMADVFDSVLTSGTKKPIFQNVPKSAPKQDPLEALKIEDRLKSKYPGVDFSVYDNGRTINVSKIVVPKTARNSGIGTKAMQEIISEADRSGKTITLTPSSDYGGSKVRLKEFYKRLGFVENKGRTKDLAISEDMYRLPTNKSQGVRDSLADGLPNPGRKPIISDADPLEAPKRIASDVGEDILPRATKGKETRGFLKQVQTSASTSPELAQAAKGVSGLYTPKSNAKLLKTARNNISSDIMKAEKIATTARTDEGVATASELIKHYQALGQYDKAVEVAQKAAKNLTEAGRQVQAASLYSRISPEGILRYTQAQIDKVGGKKLSSEVAERLTKMAREVQTMPEGIDKAYAVARLQQEISKQIPTNILKKLTTLRKAGLLTGLRTQAGNAVSNLSHIGLNKVSDLPAAAIDAVASVFTGQRTKVFTTRGLASGGAEGVGKAAKFLKTGVDELGLGASKYDISPVNFKSKTVQKYVDTVFNAMGAADKPYRYAALKNQLYDMAIAEAKNKGLRGPQAGTFIKDFIANPPMEAAQKAAAYAEKSVFGNDTLLSQGATALRNAFENNSPPMAAALDILMPFTKVPSAVITRLFDYTPVGAVKEAMKQIRVGKFDQRMFAQALGEAGTGTGAIALGVALASNGQITGPMPNDQRERDLWQLEGKQPNAIRFGDKWYSFNYTSPIGQLLQMGSEVSSAAKEGAGLLAAIEGGAWGGAKAVVDQSFLQGVSGVLEAINDHKRYAEDFAKSNAGSVIPTLIADLAKATDPLQRETNSIAEAVKARIPRLRRGLLPKQDAFGNPLAREGNAAQAMADPFRTTQAKSDPLTAELRRLQDANQGITPNADKRKYIQVGNKKYQLNPEELNSLNSATGQETQKYWNQVTQAQQYAGLSDESKKKTLDNIYTDINVVNKYRTLFERGDREAAQQIYDKMTKAQMAYLQNGQLDVNAYLAKNQPKKPRVKIAKARKPRKVRASRGRKVAVARAKVVRVKTPKIGKVPRVKARKVRLASTSGPKVRAVSPKRSRVRISA